MSRFERLASCSFAIRAATLVAIAGTASGCGTPFSPSDPPRARLTVQNECPTEISVAIGNGFDPRRSEDDLEAGTYAIEPGESTFVSALSESGTFVVVLFYPGSADVVENLRYTAEEPEPSYVVKGAVCP